MATAAGSLGLVLMRLMPVGTENEYLRSYAIWARDLKAMLAACGKHEPRNLDCVKRHAIRERP